MYSAAATLSMYNRPSLFIGAEGLNAPADAFEFSSDPSPVLLQAAFCAPHQLLPRPRPQNTRAPAPSLVPGRVSLALTGSELLLYLINIMRPEAMFVPLTDVAITR